MHQAGGQAALLPVHRQVEAGEAEGTVVRRHAGEGRRRVLPDGLQLLPEAVLGLQLMVALRDLRQVGGELFRVNRLDQVVLRAQGQRFLGVLKAAEAAEEDHPGRDGLVPDDPQELQSGQPGHGDIAEHGFGALGAQQAQGLAAAGGGEDLVVPQRRVIHQLEQSPDDDGLVVDNQQFHACVSSGGS